MRSMDPNAESARTSATSSSPSTTSTRWTRKRPAAPPPPLHPPTTSSPSIDLRRKRAREDAAAALLRHADWLTPDEQALLRAVYHDGITISDLATMSGRSHAAMRARLRRIVARLEDPCFTFVLATRESWPPAMRRVATACFLHGWPMRRAAVQCNMSIAAVRRYRDTIAALCAAQHEAAGRHPSAGAPRGGAA